ncbi:MAG: hypothetical protein J5600_04545, partial [Desulfovibrio sp.]|nr:hypothetical protein [Desulfovibrio sp.]
MLLEGVPAFFGLHFAPNGALLRPRSGPAGPDSHFQARSTMPAEKLYAIIGHPLGHSLSPALHNWA